MTQDPSPPPHAPSTPDGVEGASSFEDHFSTQAEDYARFRPHYPEALFAALATLAPAKGRAWDVATGQGQAARALAAHFDEVIAVEPSADQLAHARPHPRVQYRQATAEQSTLDDDSIDLVVAAAAAHWFDLDAFFAEVRRVTRPGAVIALFSYSNFVEVTPAIDALLNRYADEVLSPYWPELFARVRAGYTTLPFPFEEQPFGSWSCTATWSQPEAVGVFSTWSGTQRAVDAGEHDVVERFAADLAAVWPSGVETLDVRIPLFGRLGVVR